MPLRKPIPDSPLRVPSARQALVRDEHIPALDGLRGVAIALVLANNLYDGVAHGPIEGAVHALLKSSYIGVDLFFVLSGFLITGILLDTRGAKHYYRTFYVRRVLRIFPLYYGFLTIWLLITPHLPTFTAQQVTALQQQQVWYWTYLANISVALQTTPAGAEPRQFWSLAVEEQFYLLWPLVVAASTPRRLTQVCLGMMAGALVFRITWALTDYGQISQQALYTLTPARFDGLAAGSLLALGIRQPHRWAQLSAGARPLLVAALGALAILFVWQRGLHGLVMQTVGYTLVAGAAGAVLVLSMNAWPNTALSRALRSRGMRFLGRYSYGIYVVHEPLYQACRGSSWLRDGFALHGSKLLGGMAVGLVLAILSAALAVLTWQLWERHWQALKQLFPYEWDAKPPGGACCQ